MTELQNVILELGQDMSEDELRECLQVIDLDGSGAISFEEFAVWFIGGKEGIENLSDKLSGYLNNATKYREEVTSLLEEQFKKIKGMTLGSRDIRTAAISISGGKCKEATAGIIASAKVGLTEDNDKNLKNVRAELGFN